jgi:hypothetical protein
MGCPMGFATRAKAHNHGVSNTHKLKAQSVHIYEILVLISLGLISYHPTIYYLVFV